MGASMNSPARSYTAHGQAVSRDLVDLALAPYLPPCRYLQHASVEPPGFASLTLHADFVIPSSCYINSTGHFNAVESNICVNQMAYLLFVWFLEEAREHPFFNTIGPFEMKDFREKQLPNMLILSLQTSFRKVINPREFQGTLEWTAVRRRMNMRLLSMSFRFTDSANGQAEGSGLFAIT